MTTDVANLRPSTIDPIPTEVLRELPLGGVYYVIDPEGNDQIYKLVRMTVDGFAVLWWEEDGWSDPDFPWLTAFGDGLVVSYPKLPALTFKLTVEQMGNRTETVTRRRNRPSWAKPRALFNAWDRSFRAGKNKARGLGTSRVVSAEMVGRWRCWRCDGYDVEIWTEGQDQFAACRDCYWNGDQWMADTLTAAELAREGFPPGMKTAARAVAAQRKIDRSAADAFWKLLTKAGNVRDDGTCCRIEFEAV